MFTAAFRADYDPKTEADEIGRRDVRSVARVSRRANVWIADTLGFDAEPMYSQYPSGEAHRMVTAECPVS
jgi:hypothetical protein